mgnify:CR=1 FL=1
MKKAALSTKNEKELRDIVLNLGVAYIKRFTNNQLNTFRNKPVVIPLGDYRFFVGPYEIKGIHKDCWEVTRDRQLVHCFLSRLNAILYCLSCIKDLYTQSRNILEYDTKLGNLNSDLQHYTKNIRVAQDRKDSERKEILLNSQIEEENNRKRNG